KRHLGERERPRVAGDVHAEQAADDRRDQRETADDGQQAHEAVDVVGGDVEVQVEEREELLVRLLDRLVQVIGLLRKLPQAGVVAAEARQLAAAFGERAKERAQAPQIAFGQHDVALQAEDRLEEALRALLRGQRLEAGELVLDAQRERLVALEHLANDMQRAARAPGQLIVARPALQLHRMQREREQMPPGNEE